MTKAKFDGATLAGATFSSCLLEGASFEKADLRRANLQTSTGLTARQLRAASTLYQALLPPGLDEELSEETSRRACPDENANSGRQSWAVPPLGESKVLPEL